MAWTSPMTAVANATFTAAQFNSSVRDNLNETAVAKATAANQIFCSTAANTLAARTPNSGRLDTQESTTSASYTDLATAGPSVTITTGTHVWVIIQARMWNSTAGSEAWMSFAISGATTQAAADEFSCVSESATTNNDRSTVAIIPITSMTSGSNTFTAKYRCNANTASFQYRRILVLPLG